MGAAAAAADGAGSDATDPAERKAIVRVDVGRPVSLTVRRVRPGRVDLRIVPAAARREGCSLLRCDGILLHAVPARGRNPSRVEFDWPELYGHCSAGCSSPNTAEFDLARWRHGQKAYVYFLPSRKRISRRVLARRVVVIGSVQVAGAPPPKPPDPLPPPAQPADGTSQVPLAFSIGGAGTTRLVSRASGAAGAKSNGLSGSAAISESGQMIAFSSSATNLDPADGDSDSDIYVRDLASGQTELASRADGASGAKGNASAQGNFNGFGISGNGRYVVFGSAATNLDPDDTDATIDIFVRDLQADTTTLVSRASGAAGDKGNAQSIGPAISADGRYVAFSSTSTNLDPADTDADSDVYLRDLQTNATMLISRASGATGAKSDGQSSTSGPNAISASGGIVVFGSSATNLDPDDTDAKSDVYVRNVTSSTTTLVSRADGAAGAVANAFVGFPQISADGGTVTFYSLATNLDPADADSINDVYVRRLAANDTVLVSRASGVAGAKGNDFSISGRLSSDGSKAVFWSDATNLHPDDTDSFDDVYVRDLNTNTTTLISRASGIAGPKGNAQSFDPAISADGRFISFASVATNLDPADTDDIDDIYVRQIGADAPTAPIFTATSPASPANNNFPLIIGSAAAGSTVQIYANASCSGSPVATGSAAAFGSPGLQVSVADNSTTTFYATATVADETSTCSISSITYVEQTPPPSPPADLEVRKIGPASTAVGSTNTYTLTVTNRGPAPAQSVGVFDSSGVAGSGGTVDVTDASPSQGACSITEYEQVVCNLGDLAADASIEVAIKLIPLAGGMLTNHASAYSSTPDLTSGNNHVAVTTTVAKPTRCTITGTLDHDSLGGTPGADYLCGLAGPDSVWGLYDDDTIAGGDGNDTLEFSRSPNCTPAYCQEGIGNDRIDGGAGPWDYLYSYYAGAPVQASLARGVSSGGTGSDVILNVEGLVGGSYDDVLTGDSGRNVLAGSNGDDSLLGGGASDYLMGDSGDDTIRARDGTADYVYGGFGFDRAQVDPGDIVVEGIEAFF